MCITRGSTIEGWSHSRSVASTTTSSVFIQLVDDVKISQRSISSSIRHRARERPRRVSSSPREATRRRAWVTHRGARCTMRVLADSIARGSVRLTARPPRARRATRPRATPRDTSRDASDSPSDSAERVAVHCRGREVSARVGAKLRSALLLGGISPHNDAAEVINCRGLGTCGTCAVEIVPRDAVAPDEWTVAERARLNFPPHASPGNERLRLACQVRVRGPCEVRKYARFWGQGDALAPPEETRDPSAAPATFGPFGRLEFALDPEAFAESSERGKSHARGRDDDDATAS